MNERLKEAFDNIHAEEDLKNKTRIFLAQKTRRTYAYKRFIPAVVCLLFVLIGFGGYHVYFTPTSFISIDINPSFELGVNRFDRIVSIQGYNKDGDRLADSLNVRFLNYTQALKQILENDDVEAYLSRDELLSIAVISSDETRNEQMLSHIEACTSEHENTHCSSADSKEVEGAHESGLSCGKYKAYLELKALDPDITVEDIQGMTMREIWDLIDSLSPNNSSKARDGAHTEDNHDKKEDRHNGRHSNGHD